MAVIKLSKGNVPTSQQVLALAKSLYPKHEVKPQLGGKVVLVKKSGLVGASILPRKNDIVVRADFGSTGMRVLFMILIFVSVLIFAIIWLAAFFPSQAKFANEVAAKLEAEIKGGGTPAAG